MSLTDEGHYGPKQLNMLKTVWGEGFLSPGGTEEIDQILIGLILKIKKVLDTWKFSKDSRSSNPNWLLIDTQA